MPVCEAVAVYLSSESNRNSSLFVVLSISMVEWRSGRGLEDSIFHFLMVSLISYELSKIRMNRKYLIFSFFYRFVGWLQ